MQRIKHCIDSIWEWLSDIRGHYSGEEPPRWFFNDLAFGCGSTGAPLLLWRDALQSIILRHRPIRDNDQLNEFLEKPTKELLAIATELGCLKEVHKKYSNYWKHRYGN